jgi:hypothetical protein
VVGQPTDGAAAPASIARTDQAPAPPLPRLTLLSHGAG